jgi:hypothetical protein
LEGSNPPNDIHLRKPGLHDRGLDAFQGAPNRKEKSWIYAAKITQFMNLNTTMPHCLHVHAAATNGDVNIKATAHLLGSKHVQLPLCAATFERWYYVKNGYHKRYITTGAVRFDEKPSGSHR